MSAADLLQMLHFYFTANYDGLVFDVADRPFSRGIFEPARRAARRGLVPPSARASVPGRWNGADDGGHAVGGGDRPARR